MYAPYRLFGAALSPYTRKVETYLRYKGLEHRMVERTAETAGEFAALAKLPLLPLLVDAAGGALQDSTPMIETLEERHPQRAITPEDAELKFLSLLIEDFADEWLNKVLYHYRWSFEPDARAAATAIADAALGEAEKDLKEAAVEQICARMAERRALVGVSDAVAPVIEGSLKRTLAALEPVFAERPFLFGARPACADFSLAAQLEQLLQGPTAGGLMRAQAPAVCAWVERMAQAEGDGEFLPFEAAVAPLEPLLREIADVYLPWLQANAQAHGARRPRFELTLAGEPFAQAPQRYAATKAFPELRSKRQAAPADGPLGALLERLGVAAMLAAPVRPPRGDGERAMSAAADEDSLADPGAAAGMEPSGDGVEPESGVGPETEPPAATPAVSFDPPPPEDEQLRPESDA